MPIDAGDVKYRPGETVTLDSGSNTVEGGDAVKFDGSGNVTRTTGNSDDLVGVVLPSNYPDSKVSVHVVGLVLKVTVDGSVSPGDTLVPSGTNDGNFEAHAGGMYEENPDTGAGAIAANHPFTLESGTDEDVLAVFR